MNDNSTTRQQRRASERQARKRSGKGPDRADLIRLFAALVETDETLSGVTLITHDGGAEYLDADLVRRGGGRA